MSVTWVCLGFSWPQVQCSRKGLIITRSGGAVYLCDPEAKQDRCVFREISVNVSQGLQTQPSVMSELHFNLLFALANTSQEDLEDKYYNNISSAPVRDIFTKLQHEVSKQKTMTQRSISTICSDLAEENIDFFHYTDVFEALKIYYSPVSESQLATNPVSKLLRKYTEATQQPTLLGTISKAGKWLKMSFFGPRAGRQKPAAVELAVVHVEHLRSTS